MVQQAVQGAPAAYAKEMERLSAKESLLLAVSLSFFLNYKTIAFIYLFILIVLIFEFILCHDFTVQIGS